MLLLVVFSAITPALTTTTAKIGWWRQQNKVLTSPKLPLIDGLTSKVMALVLVVTKIFYTGPVQCFAGYCDVKYGHLLEGEKQKGVIVNTCKEFNLLPPQKGDPLIRATPPT